MSLREISYNVTVSKFYFDRVVNTRVAMSMYSVILSYKLTILYYL